MPALEILGVPFSNFVRTVRMACEEKNVPYTLTPARPHSPEIEAVHPFGKIPVMRHGDLLLFESKAIATYIDRSFPGPKLIPEDPKAAAETEQWISALITCIHPELRVYLQSYVFPQGTNGEADRVVIEAALPHVRKHIALFDRVVARTGYLAGGMFTLADLYLLPLLAYLEMFPESGEALTSSSSLSAYFKTHAQRASFVKTTPPPLSEIAKFRRAS